MNEHQKNNLEEAKLTRRGVFGALGLAAGLIALGCTTASTNEQDPPTGQVRQALDTALLASGVITSGNIWLPFASLISASYVSYELRLYNVYPLLGAYSYAYLAMQLSGDNGSTWDSTSCAGNCFYYAHYSFTTSFVTPGGTSVLTRVCPNTSNVSSNPAPWNYAYDQQFALTMQNGYPTGVCGSVRFSNPLVSGIYKQFEWDTSYFGPQNFCRENGAGLYFGSTSLNGSPFNAFRLGYTDANGNTSGLSFGGGRYSLVGYA